MLSKILLVTIFILLSWNSFHLSKSNAFLRHNIQQLSDNNQSIEEHILANKLLLKEHSKSLNENAQLLASNREILNKNASNDKTTITLKSIKSSIDKVQSSLRKQAITLTEQKKSLAENKKSLTENQKSLSANKNLLTENKKNIIEIKKTAYKVSDQLKKHANQSAQHSHSSVKTYVEKTNFQQKIKKPVYIKKNNTKPTVKKVKATADTTLLKQIAIEFYKTKELHRKKELEKAIPQLSKLKAEVWKSRKLKNISKELVMSILSSIDITNKKWSNKDNNYSLAQVEEKINTLFSKLGFFQ